MKLSIVTSLYYSEKYIQEYIHLCLEAVAKIGIQDFEFVFVVDGKTDEGEKVVLNELGIDGNVSFKILELSRNFGHHKALLTGLKESSGEFVFLIDADLEESPILLVDFWNTLGNNENIDVVYGIQEKRKGNFSERLTGKVFYKLFDFLADIEYPHDTTTARLMRRNYLNAVLEYPEKELELWGVFVSAGFNQVGLTVKKSFKGSTVYSFRRKVSMAVQTITSYSNKPLYFIFVLGLIMFGLSFLSLGYIGYKKIMYQDEIEGWASLLGSVWLIGGLVLSSLGVIGIYLSKVFSEVKNRPIVHIKKKY